MFGGLEERDLRLVAQRASERRYGRGQILFSEGEEAKGMFVVAQGAVQALREGPDGREQVIHVERAGSTFAEVPMFDNGSYPSTVQAIEDSVVLFLAKEDVRRLCLAYPEIALGALRLLATRLRKTAMLVESLSLRDVDRRLAALLLAEADAVGTRHGDEMSLELHLTQQQIAARIGSVREVVSRAMARLQDSGLVRLDGKHLSIPHREALAQYVAE